MSGKLVSAKINSSRYKYEDFAKVIINWIKGAAQPDYMLGAFQYCSI